MELKILKIIESVAGECDSEKEILESIFVTGVSTDSRTVNPGEVFFALKGEFFDGHRFLGQAIERGASAVVVSNDFKNQNEVIIKVKDTSRALKDLASDYIKNFPVPVVAVTGSTGKTTTKDMIASVLGEKFKVHKNVGNLNNEIGLPQTVFLTEKGCEVFVLEMGMNIAGEIKNLSNIVKPDICVITNIGVTHIENLGTVEGIFKAKCEIFEGMKKDGLVILNYDDEMLRNLEGKYENEIWFGLSEKSDIFAHSLVSKGVDGISFELQAGDDSVFVELSYPGRHMASNAAAAASVGLSMGLCLEDIKKGLEKFRPTKMRMAVMKIANEITLIDDSYNSSPTSMQASIEILDEAKTRKLAILGEMRELGEKSEMFHKQAGKQISETTIDTVICVGEGTRLMYEALILSSKEIYFFESQELLFPHLDTLIKSGDTVLVKGSRSLEMEKITKKIIEVKS